MAEGVVGWSSDDMKQTAERITANPASASPVSEPGAPDSLEITAAALNQLKASSSRLELTFAAADTEAGRMASALRAGADAFDKVVSQSKEEFDQQMHSDGARPSNKVETVVPSGVMDPAPATVNVAYPAPAETGGFANWRESAKKIHNGDGTSALKNFSTEWARCHAWLSTHVNDFNAPNGDGTAADAYTNAMNLLRSWWHDMIPECGRMVQQAENFISAHRDLVSEHPTLDDVATYEKMDPGGLVSIIVDLSPVASLGKGALNKYFQERSEAALKKYADRVAFKEIRPGMPPSIRGVPSTNPGDQQPGVNPPGTNVPNASAPPGGATPDIPEIPSVDTPSMSPASADPSAGQGSGGSPSGGSPSGGSPSSGGGAPSGGMPSGGLPKGTEGMPEVPGLGEPSLKPASAGGGGGGMGGGGGGGMPAGPLGPAVGADSVAASPAAARGGGAPAGAPGGAGAGGMGGGMGGMGGGHGQGQGKEKRRNPNLSEDEDLYVEDRAYTEAVIGRRARKDAKDGK